MAHLCRCNTSCSYTEINNSLTSSKNCWVLRSINFNSVSSRKFLFRASWFVLISFSSFSIFSKLAYKKGKEIKLPTHTKLRVLALKDTNSSVQQNSCHPDGGLLSTLQIRFFSQGNFHYEKFCLKSSLVTYSITHWVAFLRGLQMDKINIEIYWLLVYLAYESNKLLEKLTWIQ